MTEPPQTPWDDPVVDPTLVFPAYDPWGASGDPGPQFEAPGGASRYESGAPSYGDGSDPYVSAADIAARNPYTGQRYATESLAAQPSPYATQPQPAQPNPYATQPLPVQANRDPQPDYGAITPDGAAPAWWPAPTTPSPYPATYPAADPIPWSRPRSHVAASVLVTVLLCFPLGAVALYHALRVDTLWERGDAAGAHWASQRAGTWLAWAAAAGFAWLAILGIAFFPQMSALLR